MTKARALGPDVECLYSHFELPIGATAIGLPAARRTGLWRYVRPAIENKVSACHASCPLGNWVQRFVSETAAGRLNEAWRALRIENPFPGVCGRVCYHPCEEACNRKELDGAVSIQSIERYLADHFFEKRFEPVVLRERQGKSLAVVGSGPAGLACAYFMRMLGYDVVVFEAQAEPGGMMRVIPRYRLPEEVVAREIAMIRETGVEIRTNCAIGKDVPLGHLQEEGYHAVFISAGAPVSRGVQGQGGTLDGVYLGVDFLRKVNAGTPEGLRGETIVIGGGNVAIDAALTAIRLGADSVKLVCLEAKEEMPAHPWECRDALEEGVAFLNGWGLKRISGERGRVSSIEIKKCTSVFGENGRFEPLYDEKVTRTLEADTLIIAVGQDTDLSFLQGSDIQLNPGGTIQVDPETLETSVPGVFAAGDIIDQARTVSTAIGSAKRAAIAMDHYLRGEDLREFAAKGLPAHTMREHLLLDEQATSQDGKVATIGDLNLTYASSSPRGDLRRLPPDDRRKGFQEIAIGMGSQEAVSAAERCMSCGVCKMCGNCYVFCPDEAVRLEPKSARYAINYEYCKGCGICQNECPVGAITMQEEERT